MSLLSARETGADTGRLIARMILHGTAAASEPAVADTVGSTLMQQIARALSPLAAGGAWPGRNTIEPPVYPYITFFRVAGSSNISLGGPSDVQATKIQIDSFGRRYSDAFAVAEQIKARMLSTFVIGSIDEQDFPPDPDTDSFRCSIDFNVWSAD